jgi:hypothetical protein
VGATWWMTTGASDAMRSSAEHAATSFTVTADADDGAPTSAPTTTSLGRARDSSHLVGRVHPLLSVGHTPRHPTPPVLTALPPAPDDHDENASYGDDARLSQSFALPDARSESLHAVLHGSEIQPSNGHDRGPEKPPRV